MPMPMPIPRRRLNEWLALGLLAPPAWAAVAQSPPPPPLLLAHKAPPGLDPAPYLVSEKLDGVRAYWDGRAMHSRQGHPMALPAWFAERLPARALDGELWIARGRFEAASAAVRRVQPRDEEWRQLHYMLFELPAAPGSFEQRCAELRRIEADARWDGLRAVPQERVADAAALSRRLSAVVAGGGEGLMLHAADAPYRSGRDAVLLKLKPQDDDEAVVLGHVAGAGRLAGTLGALRVRSVDGREFLLGSGFTDAQRRAPPPVGAVVTYRYRGLTSKGLPRFASFVRVQEDV